MRIHIRLQTLGIFVAALSLGERYTEQAHALQAPASSESAPSQEKTKSTPGNANPPAAGAPTSPTSHSAPDGKAAERVPDWTADARWYYVVVPRFFNGDSGNDPAETRPWSIDWPTSHAGQGTDAAENRNLEFEIRDRRYGGDLQGVIKRLPYLKELGVNALCLSPIFHGSGELRLGQADLRHIDPWIGVKGSLNETATEKSDATTWQWTASDKLMLELVREAHKQQIRAVVSGIFYAVTSANNPPAELETYYLAATRRWMDPDGDGKSDDGVDGWFLSFEEGPLKPFGAKEAAFWKRWREEIYRVNPQAVVVGSGPLALAQTANGPYDIAFNEPMSGTVRGFFAPAEKPMPIDQLFDAINGPASRGSGSRRHGNLFFASVAGRGSRLLTALSSDSSAASAQRTLLPGPMPSDEARARWRLATIFQHFSVGAPVTYYGDEVGMFGGPGPFANAPMWWNDQTLEAFKSSLYQIDFFALVQWLHRMREWYAPLRHGEFRRLLADDANKVFAFGRSLPGDEIILVMNYGSQKQKIMLPAGKPGQLVAVFSPQVQAAEKAKPRKHKDVEGGRAPEKSDPLGVGGSRQFVNDDGKIRLWVAPMSVRIVFVNDKEPRG